jgi:hypothetical protein
MAAGTNLMNIASQIPCVAPIAYLIGSIVQMAADSHALNQDVREFSICVQEVERILTTEIEDLS